MDGDCFASSAATFASSSRILASAPESTGAASTAHAAALREKTPATAAITRLLGLVIGYSFHGGRHLCGRFDSPKSRPSLGRAPAASRPNRPSDSGAAHAPESPMHTWDSATLRAKGQCSFRPTATRSLNIWVSL